MCTWNEEVGTLVSRISWGNTGSKRNAFALPSGSGISAKMSC